MENNDVIRRLRYALDLRDRQVVEIFSKAGQNVSEHQVAAVLARDDADNFASCSTDQLTDFLDGLIVHLRGARQQNPGQGAPPRIVADTNNVILRKLRIAFDLKEEDMLGLLALGGFRMSKAELSALFRKQGNRHYRECGDQVLRYFIVGVTRKRRPETATAESETPSEQTSEEAPKEPSEQTPEPI